MCKVAKRGPADKFPADASTAVWLVQLSHCLDAVDMDSKIAFWTWTFWILILWCRNMSIAEEPTHIPHRAAPYEVATGGIEQRLELSGAKETSHDALHFREVILLYKLKTYIH